MREKSTSGTGTAANAINAQSFLCGDTGLMLLPIFPAPTTALAAVNARKPLVEKGGLGGSEFDGWNPTDHQKGSRIFSTQWVLRFNRIGGKLSPLIMEQIGT